MDIQTKSKLTESPGELVGAHDNTQREKVA